MNRIECPSEAWDRYVEAEEAAGCPTDAEMIAELDAYGHLTHVVGYGDDGDDRGDWLVCFDFKIFDHVDRGLLIAYHAVVNSDSGGFIDTCEAHVVPLAKAPIDLPDYWASIGMEHDLWTPEEIADADKCNESWNKAIRAECKLP